MNGRMSPNKGPLWWLLCGLSFIWLLDLGKIKHQLKKLQILKADNTDKIKMANVMLEVEFLFLSCFLFLLCFCLSVCFDFLFES